MAKKARKNRPRPRPRRTEKRYLVFEQDLWSGLRTPAKKPVQWAVSPEQAISRVRYACYVGFSYGDLERQGVVLVAEPAELPRPFAPEQTTFQF